MEMLGTQNAVVAGQILKILRRNTIVDEKLSA